MSTSNQKTAVLLVNLGTPDKPDSPSIRRYLREFLSDPRVIEVPRLLWWCILNLVILVIRPRKLVPAYQKLWQDGDSPIRLITEKQVQKLQLRLNHRFPQHKLHVVGAMTYGEPSIRRVIPELLAEGYEHLIILPLFPQYSATTTAAVFDAIAQTYAKQRQIAGLTFIKCYQDHPAYINALAQTVRDHWEQTGTRSKLLMSFHGIPAEYAEKGDPYPNHCQETARLLADNLELSDTEWLLTYQSRVGRAQWLTPYTDQTMEHLGANHGEGLDVICPGFSADCLETIEEIDEENRDIYESAGGKNFHYIPALNDQDEHIQMMEAIIADHLH